MVDAPVAHLVDIAQVATDDVFSDTGLVKLGGLRTKAGLDVAQAFPVGQLGESHAEKLIHAPEGTHVEIATVLGNQSTKCVP